MPYAEHLYDPRYPNAPTVEEDRSPGPWSEELQKNIIAFMIHELNPAQNSETNLIQATALIESAGFSQANYSLILQLHPE